MTAKLLAAGAALLIASPALARPMATVNIDNHWSAPVHVEVDGRYVGQVSGFRGTAYRVRGGFHTVTVRSARGAILANETRLYVPHTWSELDIVAPTSPVTVRNSGRTALFIEGPRAGVWIAPGTTHTAYVPAGDLVLTASIQGHAGRLERVDTQKLWVEPGRSSGITFRYAPPPPTRLFVQNLEPRPVSLFVDGTNHGMLSPGQTLALDVRPGRHDVDAYTRHGSVVFDGTVRASQGRDTGVGLFRTRRSGPSRHAHSTPPPPPRPDAPPARPTRTSYR